MSKQYVIKPGDCISSLAFENGLTPQTIWDHAENAELRQKCENIYQLIPGDKVFIPDIVRKQCVKATEAEHVFKMRGVPEIYRVQLLDCNGEPRPSLKYLFTIDGSSKSGKTDGEGRISHPIPPNARSGRLQIFDGETEEIYEVELGHLEPLTQLEGVQGRLTNLGYDCLEESGTLGEKTVSCLLEFQNDHDLELTGEPDAATKNKLQLVYGA